MSGQSRIPPYLGRYTLIMGGTMIGLVLLKTAMVRFLGTDLPAGGTAIIPPMIAVLAVGQTWGNATGAPPENRSAWRFAFIGGTIYLVIQLGITLIGLSAIGELGGDAMNFALLILAVVTVIVVFLNRLFLRLGANGVLKRR